MKNNHCLVCGAKCKSRTCDKTCASALKSGRDRTEQIEYEMEKDPSSVTCPDCGEPSYQCVCYDGL
jgi:hypothetical protein